MIFKPNDKIKFLDEEGGGIVIKVLDKKHILILLDDGFEIPVPAASMILAEPRSPGEETDPEPSHPGKRPIINSNKPMKILIRNPEPESDFKVRMQLPTRSILDHASSLTTQVFDIHIEKIVDDARQLSNAEKLLKQELYVEHIIADGLAGQFRKAIIIHGVGSGVLKRLIIQKLQQIEGLQFHDANINLFGFGATEIIFP